MATNPTRGQGARRPPPKAPSAIAMILYVVGMLVVMGVIGTLLPSVATRTVSYSDFKQMLRANEISSVVVSEPPGPRVVVSDERALFARWF